ncbi:MAG: glycosyltransferase family 39 protein, partial [Candidatus Omnitrophica bacterium]|nr:glycosyltransferase family 39 protein [Candidatus Omnitrophota bacterium]
MKDGLKQDNKFFWIAVCGIILVVNFFRFLYLDKIPWGYHVDESASALSISCMAEANIGGRGIHWPMFDDLSFGTPKPIIYTFFGAQWVKVFSNSPAAIRAISVFFACVAVVGIFFLGALISGRRAGLAAALCASISPWAWTFSRHAFESIMGPCFLVWGIYFFLRNEKWIGQIIAGILISWSMYCYPPMRMYIPLVFGVLFFYRKQLTGRVYSWKASCIFSVSFLIMSIHIMHGVLNGSL